MSVISNMAAEIVSNTPEDLKTLEAAAKSVPAKYNDANTSGLQNTVSASEKNHFEITLEPK